MVLDQLPLVSLGTGVTSAPQPGQAPVPWGTCPHCVALRCNMLRCGECLLRCCPNHRCASPGADVARPVPAQMWHGPSSPGADVAAAPSVLWKRRRVAQRTERITRSRAMGVAARPPRPPPSASSVGLPRARRTTAPRAAARAPAPSAPSAPSAMRAAPRRRRRRHRRAARSAMRPRRLRRRSPTEAPSRRAPSGCADGTRRRAAPSPRRARRERRRRRRCTGSGSCFGNVRKLPETSAALPESSERRRWGGWAMGGSTAAGACSARRRLRRHAGDRRATHLRAARPKRDYDLVWGRAKWE